MGKLVGLEGTSRDIDCLFIKKGSEIDVILRNDLAATDAGNYGAINIWRDDEGFIRCECTAHFRSVEKKKYKSISSAIQWANRWIVKIRKGKF